ncbi:uncharacterized protein LOC144732394 [Lampetra planeri]
MPHQFFLSQLLPLLLAPVALIIGLPVVVVAAQRPGVSSGGHPQRTSPYFQTLAVADLQCQRPEPASLSSREDLDHCLSERYEEEMAVNSGRRLVQRYEQEKSRLAEGLLHPRLHG